jgi:hypothetical protein
MLKPTPPENIEITAGLFDWLEQLRRWAVAWFSGRPIRTGPSPSYRVWRDRQYGRRK